MTYAAAIDDPSRFKSSKTVGALFGLTPKRYQSGQTDVTGRISKIGDAAVRTALCETANIILERPIKGGGLKSLGAGRGQAGGHAQGQGGAGAQAGGGAAPHGWPMARRST